LYLIATLILAFMVETAGDDCIKVQTTVAGSSMKGLLWQGQEIEVLGLGCGWPSRYDYVVFREKGSTTPVIKQLWGLPGDKLEVSSNGKFTVNGVQAKTPYGRAYLLAHGAKKRMLALSGVLDGYLVLGHPGSIDSTKIGLIQEKAILGYVLPDQDSTKEK
jgi:signal peptidase I